MSLFQDFMLTGRDDGSCQDGNDFNGMMGARISSIFVILVGGTFGAVFPVISSRSSKLRMPQSAYFIAKYFGSGVIVATSLIHLLQPANEALSDPCLGPKWQEYPYAFGICLFVLFLTFLLDILTRRYLEGLGITHDHGPSGLASGSCDNITTASSSRGHELLGPTPVEADASKGHVESFSGTDSSQESSQEDEESMKEADYHAMMAQIGTILFLEFGIIFHSVFIGLTLAVSGEEFKTLYIVLAFHQTFEGLGLGTRVSACKFPKSKSWVPWALCFGYGVTTPIAIGIGLGLRQSYPPNSKINMITNGVFDSISAGILIYVGLVELMANEFLHSHDFKRAELRTVLAAFGIMCLGAGVMALLGRWA